MATYTTNINLKKPAQSDKIRIADFNGNADNIDAAFGADFGQSSKPSVNASINNLADGLAIVAQGNVHAAISAGQFVYVRGHGTLGEGLYVANQAISANGTLSSSNLDADTSGGLNALNSKMVSKEVKLSLGSAYSSGWVSDFLNLPSVTNRALFTIYNASQAEWMNGMKRESDQNIAISNVQTALQNQTIYVTGIFK